MADLLSLPDELLVIILEYLSPLDIVHVSRVCRRLHDITWDQKFLSRTSKLNCRFHTQLQQGHLKAFLSNRIRAENVTSIDLTSCYWLTSSYIFNLVSRLTNLENILVADTALLPNHLKQLLQRLPRVKRLSWTWHKDMNDIGIEEALKKLHFLYLCVHQSDCFSDVVKLLRKCVELRELWINIVDAVIELVPHYLLELEHLEKIVINPCTFRGLSVKTKSSIKQFWLSVFSIERHDVQQVKDIEAWCASSWSVVTTFLGSSLSSKNIEILSCSAPAESNVGEILWALPKLRALLLVLPERFSLDGLMPHNIPLTELNLRAASRCQECSTGFCEIASTYPKLKSLSLPLQALVCESSLLTSTSVGCSSKRVSRALEALPSGTKTPFGEMVNNTPQLETFELGVSNENCAPNMPGHLHYDFLSLSMIGSWKNLTSLTLAHIPVNHGKFFMPMLKNCKNLRSLKIIDLGPQASCIYTQDLCHALPWCTQLQDFHWTQSNVGKTKRLWAALQQAPFLQRIALRLKGRSEIVADDIHKTMEKCASLCFLHIVSNEAKVKLKKIKDYVKSWWLKDRPHLSVWLGNCEMERQSFNNCPIVHLGEMLHAACCSQVTRVPAFNSSFLSFGARDWLPE